MENTLEQVYAAHARRWHGGTRCLGAGLVALLLVVAGCHADPDDAAGQARELSDPVRRQNAIVNLHRLYTKALADRDGDRSSAEVRAIADAAADKLTQTYIDHPEDTQNGLDILELLKEMRDPRTLPALLKALDWRPEVSEEHAIRAAQTFQFMDLPDGKSKQVVSAISGALSKVTQSRGVDNRMRIEMIRALGALHDRSATSVLTKVATTQSENQNFLINRLAAQQLGRLGDPAAVPAMIKGLFLFAPSQPRMRMNDVAAEALVRIGRPSLAPLLKVLRGEHEAANAIAKTYIDAIRQRDARAAGQMSVRAVTSSEATFALGALGFRDALAPLIKETEGGDRARATNAVIALVRLGLRKSDIPRVRGVITKVFEETPSNLEGAAARAQLISAIRHMYDPGMLPFILKQMADREQHPQVRIEAATSYAMLANKSEAKELRQATAREPASTDGGYRENFAKNERALAAAVECNSDVQCWLGKLNANEAMVVRKAAYMLGRFGLGNAKVIDALVGKLDHGKIEVRLAVVAALDHVAVKGSQAGIDKIEELRTTEDGRAIWTQFSREALPIQARLRARTAG